MAQLWNDLKAGRSTLQILSELRETHREEAFAAPFYLEATRSATWQRGITINDRWVFGCAIINEPVPGRGWFVAYAGKGLTDARPLRVLKPHFLDVLRLGPWDELRAWILVGEEREERFASRYGFRLDCGPATGFSASGRDMNLWLWRR